MLPRNWLGLGAPTKDSLGAKAGTPWKPSVYFCTAFHGNQGLKLWGAVGGHRGLEEGPCGHSWARP